MDNFVIGQYVYEIFDPKNSGTIKELTLDDVIINTSNGLITLGKDKITNDYHQIIKNLLENVEEWKELWGQSKRDIRSLQNR